MSASVVEVECREARCKKEQRRRRSSSKAEVEDEGLESFSEKANLCPSEVRRGFLTANMLHGETNGIFLCLSKNDNKCVIV